jgi:hypothetical protein
MVYVGVFGRYLEPGKEDCLFELCSVGACMDARCLKKGIEYWTVAAAWSAVRRTRDGNESVDNKYDHFFNVEPNKKRKR